jgi:1,2-phenylacetyl-CoA epoxidase catalytic subunit
MTHGERLDRLEQVVHVLAEEQLSLERTVAEMATHMRAGFDQVAQMQRRTDEQMRQTDQRIDKLVLAMGEIIRRENSPPV